MPTASELVPPLVALPPLNDTGLPKFEPSILNCTVPLGVPAPGAVAPTVTVKLTFCPKTDGVSDELTMLAVLALFTVCVKSADVLVRKFPSPLYSAVITCGPTDKEAIVPLLALPPLKLTDEPKSAPSSLNCTVPLGVPDPGAVALIVAVNVTGCPNTDGLKDELTTVVVSAWLTV